MTEGDIHHCPAHTTLSREYSTTASTWREPALGDPLKACCHRPELISGSPGRRETRRSPVVTGA